MSGTPSVDVVANQLHQEAVGRKGVSVRRQGEAVLVQEGPMVGQGKVLYSFYDPHFHRGDRKEVIAKVQNGDLFEGHSGQIVGSLRETNLMGYLADH